MAYCNECAFFTDAGRCRNGAAKRSDVGYFQAACALFEEMKAEDKPEKKLPKIESKQPLKPSPMEQEKPKTKHCNKCGRDLPLDAFGKKTTSKDGLQSWCKECQKASTINARAKRKNAQDKPEIEHKPGKIEHKPGKIEHAPAPAPMKTPPRIPNLYEATDADLIEELKGRGYSGKLTKAVIYEF